jgi:PAS domain S-box-containing protein
MNQNKVREGMNPAKEYLEVMIENIKDFAIISTDSKGNVTSWNQGAECIFNYTQDEVMGKSLAIIFSPEDCADHIPEREMQSAIENGSSNDERWHLRKNGEYLFGSGTTTAIYDAGQLLGFMKILRDETEKKQYEEMLIYARNEAEAANQAKSEFLANMSHEIRTPINSVIGATELLLGTELTNEQKEYVDTIYQGGEILLSLINDILDFSKIAAGEMKLHEEPLSINKLIEETNRVFKNRADRKHLSFYIESADSIPDNTLIGDSSRLRQIIFNLMSNAIKFTNKGTVRLRIRTLHKTAKFTTLCFEVQDTGIGIAPDKIDTIFEKFEQASSSITKKYGGTGLGLAISKQLTLLMGGTIHVQSKLGEGSSFSVAIPFKHVIKETIAPPVLAQEKSRTPPPDHVQFQARVLLVEDYPPNQKIAKKLLEKMGCTVDTAGNGEEAIEKLHENRYDIVFMDVQMPEMDGYTTTQLIRKDKTLAGILIIAMTANALEGDKEKCIAAGMNDYISKPLHRAEIEAMLYNYLEHVS